MKKTITTIYLIVLAVGMLFAQNNYEVPVDIESMIEDENLPEEIQNELRKNYLIEEIQPANSMGQPSKIITQKKLSLKSSRQRLAAEQNRLKTTGLIKYLNEGTSSYYQEKLDSIVDYEPTLVANYDSIPIQNTIQTRNESGYLVEAITQVYDSVSNSMVNTSRAKYTPDPEGRLLQQLNYNWAGEDWALTSKNVREYNSGGIITLDATYNWNGSTWINYRKYEYEYNADGKRTLFTYSTVDENNGWIVYSKTEDQYHENGEHAVNNYFSGWNTTDETWTFEGKTEYDENGQRTMVYVKRYNVATKEWSYSYKYEYEYLEDGSIVESSFGWNPDTKELYLQYESRYKYEREYENGKITQEVRLNYVSGNWSYDTKRTYQYDQWGNEILYELYDPYWGDYGEIKERRIQAFAESGNQIKLEQYRWEIDENNWYNKQIGVQFWEYEIGSDDQPLSYTIHKWDEEKEEWQIYIRYHYEYPSENERISKIYQYSVEGYYPNFEKDYVTVLDYDDLLGKYVGIYDSYGYKMQITYNNDLKVDHVTYVEEDGLLSDSIKCFYDELGRDTAWYNYRFRDNAWAFSWKQTFSYQALENGQRKITERWIDADQDYESFNEWYDLIYNSEDQLILVVDKWYNADSDSWSSDDSTFYSYNSEGQLIEILNESGESYFKTEYQFQNDTLTIKEYDGYVEEPDSWRLWNIEVCEINTAIPKEKFQPIPSVILGGKEYDYEFHAHYDYGLVLSSAYYYQPYEDEMKLEDKSIYYYSPAALLSGETTVSGFIYEGAGTEKAISISEDSGTPVAGVKVSLLSRDDDFVLAVDTTGTDGYYEFKGVPGGDFYLKVELDGFEQTSTYELTVTGQSANFENKNFIVQNGEVVTNLNEQETSVRVYPNPVSDFIYVQSSDKVEIIRIIDFSGKVQYIRDNIEEKYFAIPVDKLGDGVYLVQIQTNGSSYFRKFVVCNNH